MILGLVAFAFGTAAGIIFGKILCKATHGKVNPLIGSAGVSAVPMAARVSQKVGSEADPTNFLLMHAMGPNVAGGDRNGCSGRRLHGDFRSVIWQATIDQPNIVLKETGAAFRRPGFRRKKEWQKFRKSR